MYIIRPIQSSSDKWSWNSSDKHLEFRDDKTNKPLGLIQMVSIQDQNSKQIYQQPWWLESRGEIDIIVTPEKEIVFVLIERHSVIPPELYLENWGERPPNPFELKSGVTEYELPRGFSANYKIEAEEETRYKVDHIATIGHVNANTAFFGTSPIVAVYKALQEKSGKKPELSERIRKVEFLSPSEVAHLNTVCGFTMAALWKFCQWAMTKQDEIFWHDVANEILNEWLTSTK